MATSSGLKKSLKRQRQRLPHGYKIVRRLRKNKRKVTKKATRKKASKKKGTRKRKSKSFGTSMFNW